MTSDDNIELVSIVIPVFNSEKFLRKCLNSILVQTYTNFEAIMVNDGSLDDSETICKDYASIDKRFILYTKSNGGVSSARNFGIDKANGKWLMFVDSDDWLDPSTLENCINNSHKTELVRFNFKSVFKDNHIIVDRRLQSTWNFREYFSKVYSRETILGVCGGLYLRSVFEDHNIKFSPKYSMGEDWLVLIEYLQYVNSVKILDTPYYNYNKINEASSTSKLNSKKVMELVEVSTLICFNRANLAFVNETDIATLKSNVCGNSLSSLIVSRCSLREFVLVLKRMQECNIFPSWNELIKCSLNFKYKLVLIGSFILNYFI